MKTALYKTSIVLVICKSTKNCRIARDINDPKTTELVPTSDLTFPDETPGLEGLFFPGNKVAPPKVLVYSKATVPIKIYNDFLELATAMSPENLSHDGELPHSKVVIRRQQLMRQWLGCERDLGMKVTEDMVWNAHIAAGESLARVIENTK